MSGMPIELQREAVRAIAGQLRAGDTVSMVTWDVGQRVVMEGHDVRSADDPAILDAADALGAGGGTDLNGGLVRGYDYNSFQSTECLGAPAGTCPVFDRLVGSRVAIANAELRFPIWGAFGGDQFYGPLPIEAAFFTDAGVAWGSSDRLGFAPGDHQPVVSVGAAVRVNVLGFAVAEIDYVRPLDRLIS